MKHRSKNLATAGCRMRGEAIVRVLNPDGSVAHETAPQRNLILYPGILDRLNNAGAWISALVYCRAGTGTNPNSSVPDGTFARSGTTVTRSSGTGTFSAGDVGKVLKFSGGEEAYISGYTSSTEVETRESGTIAATTVVLWDTSQTALQAQVASTTTLDAGGSSNTVTHDTGAGTTAIKRTYNFAAEVGSVSYAEIGISRQSAGTLLSRIVLGSTVNVAAGQQLQVVYTLTLGLTGSYLASTAVDAVAISGWPYPYTITDITSDPAYFDVTFSDDHHYSAGAEVTISNALPVKASISTIASDPTEFTVVTSGAHGLTVADSVEIEGTTPGGYNGTWTVAAVDSTTQFRVTSAINLGAGSGGTVRLSTPGSWYDGTWTVASVPAANQIRITSAINPIAAGEGDLVGSLKGDARFQGTKPFGDLAGGTAAGITDPLSTSDIILAAETTAPLTLAGLGTNMVGGDTTATRAESRTVDTDNHSYSYSGTFNIDQINSTTIYGFLFHAGGSDKAGLVWKFDQPQRKDTGYILQLGYTMTYRPDLA